MPSLESPNNKELLASGEELLQLSSEPLYSTWPCWHLMMKSSKNFFIHSMTRKPLKSEYCNYLSYHRASMVSGFASSFSSLPFDNAKTKLQKMKPDA